MTKIQNFKRMVGRRATIAITTERAYNLKHLRKTADLVLVIRYWNLGFICNLVLVIWHLLENSAANFESEP